MDSEPQEDRGRLERTLGLREALAIGMGTMVGAGIFIFPGLAAGEAGRASLVSFALGALVAMFVALPIAELASAMPRSGGGYFFVSRGLGARLGAVIGIGLWWGLIFATAFYAVGFGHYVGDLLNQVGWGFAHDTTVLAVSIAVALTVVNLLGTEKAGKVQNIFVAVLTLALAAFLVFGVLDVTGFIGSEYTDEKFAPHGWMPVLTTTSLIFTSYLGFAQIANVAGEVKSPARNLPLAMVGSVLIVALLYMMTIFVVTGVFDSATLGEMGETAMLDVAAEMLSTPGRIAILAAGLLATLSSANASLLSSSRSIFALGRDEVLPARLGRVNKRFSTPHYSIIGAGLPIVVLVVSANVDLLAEVASFLHLVMYGAACFTLVQLRRRDPDWYQPRFRVPGSPALPLLGGVASFAVIAFMQPGSILIGLAVLAAAFAWYLIYARNVELEGAFE